MGAQFWTFLPQNYGVTNNIFANINLELSVILPGILKFWHDATNTSLERLGGGGGGDAVKGVFISTLGRGCMDKGHYRQYRAVTREFGAHTLFYHLLFTLHFHKSNPPPPRPYWFIILIFCNFVHFFLWWTKKSKKNLIGMGVY